MFMKRFMDDNWDEEGDRDATDFLDIEKSIFLQEFPMYTDLFRYENEGEDEDHDDDEEEDNDKNDKRLKDDEDNDEDDDYDE